MQMKSWAKEFANAALKARVRTPPTLSCAEFEGLCSVFRYFDQDGSGHLSLDELVEQGLIYEDQKAVYLREWDRDGDGKVGLMELRNDVPFRLPRKRQGHDWEHYRRCKSIFRSE